MSRSSISSPDEFLVVNLADLVRMKEHRKKVEAQEGRKYTRSPKKQSQSEQNKSAITDDINQENRVARKLSLANEHSVWNWM